MTGNQTGCCEVKDKRKVVEHFYRMENVEWQREVHKNGGTTEENIEETLNSISSETVMYEIIVSDKLAAFFCKYENEDGRKCLEGFHVKKEFRNPSFLNEFWSIVRESFDGEFWVGIYDKNLAALNHLKKQGFEIERTISEDGKHFFILKSE